MTEEIAKRAGRARKGRRDRLRWLRAEFKEELFLDHLVLHLSAKDTHSDDLKAHSLADLQTLFNMDQLFREDVVFNATYWHARILKRAIDNAAKESSEYETKESYEREVCEVLSRVDSVNVYNVLRAHQENFLPKFGLTKEEINASGRALYHLLSERYLLS